MMDKTIPYYPVIMHRKAGSFIPKSSFPVDYHLEFYCDGDEKDWVDIAISLGEFSTEADGLNFFRNQYLTCKPELVRRCMFLTNRAGQKIGTLTNWWAYTGVRRDPWIQWFLIRPEYQGKGLGKAMFFECLQKMICMEGDRDIYLHTQTWSYKGINIYRNAGFFISSENGLGGYENSDFEKADKVLQEYYR